MLTIAVHLFIDGQQMEHSNSRRRHSAQFKAEVLAACAQPGVSLASVALRFGLNANLVRQWCRGRGTKRAGDLVAAMPGDGARAVASQQFIPLSLPAPVAPAGERPSPAAGDIRVELRRGALQVAVSWPVAGGADCAALLRELLR
jgi:transposase